MKLKAYIKTLNELVKKYPNIDVVCAGDEEGNSYQRVQFLPTLGFYDGTDFTSENVWDEDDGELEINAICIN